jgi:hypothetical protein
MVRWLTGFLIAELQSAHAVGEIQEIKRVALDFLENLFSFSPLAQKLSARYIRSLHLTTYYSGSYTATFPQADQLTRWVFHTVLHNRGLSKSTNNLKKNTVWGPNSVELYCHYLPTRSCLFRLMVKFTEVAYFTKNSINIQNGNVIYMIWFIFSRKSITTATATRRQHVDVYCE